MAKKEKKKLIPEHQRRHHNYRPIDRWRLLKALQDAHAQFDEASRGLDNHAEKTSTYNALKAVRIEYRYIFLSEAPDRQAVAHWLFTLNKKKQEQENAQWI